MPLSKDQYDFSYFEYEESKRQGLNPEPIGYSWYEEKDQRNKELADKLIERFDLKDGKVLELGCAKGYLIKALRKKGVDCYGLDFSDYAVDNADSEAKPYIKKADVREELKEIDNNEYSLIFSKDFIGCLSNKEAVEVTKEAIRISDKVCFISSNYGDSKYYNMKNIKDWEKLLPSEVFVLRKEDV